MSLEQHLVHLHQQLTVHASDHSADALADILTEYVNSIRRQEAVQGAYASHMLPHQQLDALCNSLCGSTNQHICRYTDTVHEASDERVPCIETNLPLAPIFEALEAAGIARPRYVHRIDPPVAQQQEYLAPEELIDPPRVGLTWVDLSAQGEYA